jgi:hypothetical protein
MLRTRRTRKIIYSQTLIARRSSGLHVGCFSCRWILWCLCHHIDPPTVAALATSASRTHPTQCRRRSLPAARRSPFPRGAPAGGRSLSRRLKPRRPTAYPTIAFRCILVRRDPSDMSACRAPTSSRATRYVVRGRVAGSDVARVRGIRLRCCRSACTEHRRAQSNAQHHCKHRSAKKLLRACAVFRLSMGPLRHHHHKF